MKNLKTVIFLVLFILIGLTISSVKASNLYLNDIPKDTDLDGLTDQGELQLFLTDPNNPDSDGDGFLDGTEILVGLNPLDSNNPLQEFVKPQRKEIPWTWYLARVSGVMSYLLLFLLTISGVGLTTSFIFTFIGPILVWRIHRMIGIALIAFIAIHLITLYFDSYMNFSRSDLLIPFFSNYEPLYLSLGIIGLYLFILIMLISLVLIVKKYKFWRLLHYLTFPTFIMLFVHGVFLGTDTQTFIMQIIYWSTGIIALLAFIYRLIKIPSFISHPPKNNFNQ